MATDNWEPTDDMELRALGATGLTVPAVGMGTWRTFDVVGAALEADRASARVVRRTVDIYQIHNLVAWQTHLPELEILRGEGRVSVIGATHYDHSAFGELIDLMRSGRIGQIQIPYNALDREAAREVLPAAHDLGIGVLVMRPLGEGALIGRGPSVKQLEPLHPFGVHTWAQALLKWVLSDTRVHAVIPATSRPERMRENAAAGSPPWFDAETRDYVARLLA